MCRHGFSVSSADDIPVIETVLIEGLIYVHRNPLPMTRSCRVPMSSEKRLRWEKVPSRRHSNLRSHSPPLCFLHLNPIVPARCASFEQRALSLQSSMCIEVPILSNAPRMRYLVEWRNCTHLSADDDEIARLTDRHVAISATCWRILPVRSVGVRPGRLPCPRRDLAPTVRRRLGPHHHQPPRRVCSSCAAFYSATSACVSTCACAFVHHSVDCGGHDRSVCSPCYLCFLCLSCMPLCIDSSICLRACSLT